MGMETPKKCEQLHVQGCMRGNLKTRGVGGAVVGYFGIATKASSLSDIALTGILNKYCPCKINQVGEGNAPLRPPLNTPLMCIGI